MEAGLLEGTLAPTMSMHIVADDAMEGLMLKE
jgi:hypothetical protein